MKRILILLLCIVSTITIYANPPKLNVENLFDGRYNNNKSVTISIYKSNGNYYRGLTVKNNPEIIKQIAEAIAKDQPRAKDFSDYQGNDGQYTSLQIVNNGETIYIGENDSTAWWKQEQNLKEVVVVGQRTVLKQSPDRIVYLTRNDIYAKGLNGIEVLDRIPRVSVVNDLVTVAGKSSVRYIVDGRLLEMSEEAIALQLKNLQASGIEKIELLTTPPAKYAAGTNVAYISIVTRNESLGTRGNVWGRGIIKEDFCYQLGGNISHTTRKVELSADASWTDTKGINDLDRTYTFIDHIKTSNRRTDFTNKQFGINGLFKYKFSDRLSAGAIVNASGIRLKSQLTDVTIDNGTCFNSYNNSPSRPNNALTLTAFSDWLLDSKGKILSLTYNYFNKSTESFTDVTTTGNDETVRLTDDAHNKYHIHSAKLDAVLPFDGFKMEAGLAYTSIGNKTSLTVNRYINNQWEIEPMQSNGFDYDENTVAAYISVEKSFTKSLFGKLGLRYEHTDVKGRQTIGNESHNNSYGYLFPSVNLSWNNQKIGRFSVSYSMGITRPNFADLNPFRYYTTTSDYVSGNPDLRPSLAHNAIPLATSPGSTLMVVSTPSPRTASITARQACMPLITVRSSAGGA